MDYGLLYENNEGVWGVEWRSPRFACFLALFTLARTACLLHFCVKTCVKIKQAVSITLFCDKFELLGRVQDAMMIWVLFSQFFLDSYAGYC